QIVEVALDGLVHDLVIRHRSLQLAVPIDQTIPTKNQAVLEHPEERPAHRSRADVVHSEALPIPVTRAAHRLLLADDTLLILLLPFPDALYQTVASNIVAGLALQLQEALLDDCLRRNPCVVRTRHPQRVVS